jgi:hypothetical protein
MDLLKKEKFDIGVHDEGYAFVRVDEFVEGALEKPDSPMPG